VVGDDPRSDGWNIGDVLWHDNQVQRAATLMCWTQDSLRQTELIKKFCQTNTVGVAKVLNMNIEVAADDGCPFVVGICPRKHSV